MEYTHSIYISWKQSENFVDSEYDKVIYKIQEYIKETLEKVEGIGDVEVDLGFDYKGFKPYGKFL